MEKETLEEAAERYVNKYYSEEGYKRDIEESIKFGAKWQQDRSYSEEEVLCMLLNNPYQFEDNIKEWFEQNKKK